ncbi:MAG: hypothetical protein ACLQBL_19505 [Polyangiaceae bacterium]
MRLNLPSLSFAVLLPAVAAVTFAPRLAFGDCPVGKMITTETKGQCCWPGQVFSTSKQACEGIPDCPSGLVEQSGDCVLAAASRARVCTPGAQVACACQGSGAGIQVCAEDGSHLAACQCAAAPAPVPRAPTLPAAPAKTPVRVVAERGTAVAFMSSGEPAVRCIADASGGCAVNVVPGAVSVVASRSDRRYERTIRVRADPITVKVSLRTADLAGPIVATSVGGAAVVAGLLMYGTNGYSTATCTVCNGTDTRSNGLAVGGLLVMTVGGVAAGAGLITLVIFHSTSHDSIQVSTSAQAPSSSALRVGFVPLRGGGVGGLTFRF